MTARLPLIAMTAGCLLLSGCGRFFHRRDNPPRPCRDGGPAYSLPPQNIPDGPPPIGPVPRTGGVDPVPRTGGVELLTPEPMRPGAKSDYFAPPESAPPPKASETINPDPPVTKSFKPAPAPAPAAFGIAGFARVKDGVSTGLRPEIEGLDWLRSKDYKTVVFLRTPAEDNTTDQRQAEKRDLKFVSWEVTPEGLNKFFIEEFNRVIGDTGGRPVFVYSKDGNTAAAVWYLHLRTAEFLTHEEARLRVAQLGLTDEQSPYFKAAVNLPLQ